MVHQDKRENLVFLEHENVIFIAGNVNILQFSHIKKREPNRTKIDRAPSKVLTAFLGSIGTNDYNEDELYTHC